MHACKFKGGKNYRNFPDSSDCLQKPTSDAAMSWHELAGRCDAWSFIAA